MRVFSRARVSILVLAACLVCTIAVPQANLRARDLGIFFEGEPGPINAITDVAGVAVGHTTLIEGEGALRVGSGPVRTGVTVILPRQRTPDDPVFAGWFALNGNGEMTGTTWVEESGFLEGPISITNTHSVGTVRDAVIAWQAETGALFQPWSLPVVAETYDGGLNDINGFHVEAEHVVAALSSASSGRVQEGGVGGGTGMVCYGFKGGIGTASRRLVVDDAGYTVGVLVQANFGSRHQLRIDGVPVGRELAARAGDRSAGHPALPGAEKGLAESPVEFQGRGSIIIVVATDAPLLPHQLKRLARRASLGVARTGGTSSNYSGDIFIAFSTANPSIASTVPTGEVMVLNNARISPIFDATVQATEEAIINALVAGETMIGRDGRRIEALPLDQVAEILKKYNRLTE